MTEVRASCSAETTVRHSPFPVLPIKGREFLRFPFGENEARCFAFSIVISKRFTIFAVGCGFGHRPNDILNSEAPCFILTNREPEKLLACYERGQKVKVGSVVQLFPRYHRRGLLSYSTFKVFSGPPLQNIGASLRLSVYRN